MPRASFQVHFSSWEYADCRFTAAVGARNRSHTSIDPGTESDCKTKNSLQEESILPIDL